MASLQQYCIFFLPSESASQTETRRTRISRIHSFLQDLARTRSVVQHEGIDVQSFEEDSDAVGVFATVASVAIPVYFTRSLLKTVNI